MGWDCKDQKALPGPFPKRFPKVTSSFFVYYVPDWQRSNAEEIRRASDAATLQFIGLTGLTPDAFVSELQKKLGSYDPTFDVDAAIVTLKPTARLKIRVRLSYRHFLLRHPKFPDTIPVIISLPDRVLIEARETHRCTEEGVIRTGGAFAKYKVVSEFLVRATAEDAHRLRSRKVRKDIKLAKAKIKLLKEQLKQLESDLEDMKPN